MKKVIISGLIVSLLPTMCPAVYTRISDLVAEKQQKLNKLEKCQGTTKNLKIAGLSTLGITAIGVGANIAEAVVLNDYKDQVKTATAERDKQQKIKDDREEQEAAERARAEAARREELAKNVKQVVKLDFHNEIKSEQEAKDLVKNWASANNMKLSDCKYEYNQGTDSEYILCFNEQENAKYHFKFKKISYAETKTPGEYKYVDDNADVSTITWEVAALQRANDRHVGYMCEKTSSTMVVCTNEKERIKYTIPFKQIYEDRESYNVATHNEKAKRLFDSIAAMTKDCDEAKNWLEKTLFAGDATCMYADNNTFNCGVYSGEYKGEQNITFNKITGTCTQEPDEMDNLINEIQQCQETCEGRGMTVESHSPCKCKENDARARLHDMLDEIDQNDGKTLGENETKDRMHEMLNEADAVIEKYCQGCDGCRVETQIKTINGVRDTWTVVYCGGQEQVYDKSGNQVDVQAVKEVQATSGGVHGVTSQPRD